MLTCSVQIIQHKELSTNTWIVLILIVLFILFLNLWLFSAFKKKSSPSSQVMQRLITGIREPEHIDEKMRQQLNERVERLKKENPPSKEQ